MKMLIGASIEVSVSDTGVVSSSEPDMTDIIKHELSRIETDFAQRGVMGDPLIALRDWLIEVWHAQAVEPYEPDVSLIY